MENSSENKKVIVKKNRERVEEITNRIHQLIIEINKNSKNNQGQENFSDLFEEWLEIKKECKSKNDFKNFIINLYKIIYEKTRENIKNYNGKSISYNYRLPKSFTEIGTENRNFFDIVGTLRHEYAHSDPRFREPKYSVKFRELQYPEILEMFLGNRNEHSSVNEFQRLQIKLLMRFEDVMEILSKIIKNELPPRKP